MPDRWLTVDEAAERTRRSRRTILRWVSEGVLIRRAGRVSEKALLDAERDMRARSKATVRAREVIVSIGGHTVGVVRYNPRTGRVVGDIEPGLRVTSLVAQHAAR